MCSDIATIGTGSRVGPPLETRSGMVRMDLGEKKTYDPGFR